MFRYLILGLLVSAGLIGGQLFLGQTTQPETAPLKSPSSTVGSQALPTSHNAAAGSSGLAVSKSMASTTNAPENSSSQIASTTQPEQDRPWQIDETAPDMPTKYSNRGFDARPLKIDKQQLAQVTRGDSITLTVPQSGQDYEMSVEEVGRHANGDRSLKGHLVKNPEFTVVMTEGRTATFATINTPDGSFVLEASGDEGWMLSLAELDNLVDPNLVDYQIPEFTR